MVFPVIVYGYKNWTLKKNEHWRIDAFELWCWTRLLRVPGTARLSNQSVLKAINPEYSLEGWMMLKLKLQYFGHLMRSTDSFEKTLMLGKIEGRRRREQQEDEMVGWQHWLDGHEFEQALGVGDGQGSLVCCSPWHHKESNMTEWLDWLDWTYVGYFHLLAIMLLWTFMSGKLLKLLNSQFLPQTNGIKIPERWGDRWWLDFFLKLSLPSNSNG